MTTPQPLFWKTTSAKTPPSLPLLWKELEGKGYCHRAYCTHTKEDFCYIQYPKDKLQTAVNECVEQLTYEVEGCDIEQRYKTYINKKVIEILGRSG